ncbi:MAG: hypothetical protein ACI4ES_16760 [Roseburia sp.]
MKKKVCIWVKKGMAVGITFAFLIVLFPYMEKRLLVQAREEPKIMDCNIGSEEFLNYLRNQEQYVYWRTDTGEVRPMQILDAIVSEQGEMLFEVCEKTEQTLENTVVQPQDDGEERDEIQPENTTSQQTWTLPDILFVMADGMASGDFSKVEDKNISDIWSVTYKVSNQSLGASLNGSMELYLPVENQGMLLVIDHSAANTVFPEAINVTALMLDDRNSVYYYGHVNSDSSSIQSEIELTENLQEGVYQLFLFAEKSEDDGKMNAATALGEPILLYVTEDSGEEILLANVIDENGIEAYSDTDVYSVDVEWGAMTFVYEEAGWDTTTLTSCGEGEWKVYDYAQACSVEEKNTSINQLAITNYSTDEIYAALQYDNSRDLNVQGVFQASEDTKGYFYGAENGIPAYLWLEAPASGKSSKGSVFFMPMEKPLTLSGDFTAIGTIRIRIQTDKPQ